MEELKLKKIPFAIAFFSILMLLFGLLTKDYDGSYYYNKQKIPPLDLYDVRLFGWGVDYRSYMLFFVIVLGIGIYMLIFKTDLQLKSILKFPKIQFDKISNKRELDVEKSKHDTNKEVNKIVIKIVEVGTLIALFLTFYMATLKQYSLWFFIILSYFYYLKLKPKSVKEIVLKSIFYPLIFLLLFAVAGSGDAYDRSSMKYFLSKHIIPYLISVTVIFLSQRHKLINQPRFSLRNPLFFGAILCLIAAIATLVMD